MAGTEVMTVANLEEMEARVDISEIDVILIALGQKARLEVDAFRDRKFTGTVTEIANSSKGSGPATSSSFSSSSSQQQEATKFEVKIRVQEKELFRPGMSVTAEIETRSRSNVLTVPIQSVTTRLPKKSDEKKNLDKAQEERANAVVSAKTNGPVPSRTNSTRTAENKKPGESPKPIEVVFVVDGAKVKMLPVKRGISDDAYVEVIEGLNEGQEIVSGGYKAINRELEDGKRIKKGQPEEEKDKEKKEGR
jgi:HlyD family secretion protein